ncbi:MAG: hypothetical protein Q7K38_00435, partial [Candidatus Wildermuthbacteria bacterium]|nr:hypothetical protein [Candidatus Wildermuthbacteria bacterium]
IEESCARNFWSFETSPSVLESVSSRERLLESATHLEELLNDGVPPVSAVLTFAIVALSAPKELRRPMIALIWSDVRPDACVNAGEIIMQTESTALTRYFFMKLLGLLIK